MSILVKALTAAETFVENVIIAVTHMKVGDTYRTSSELPSDIVVVKNDMSLHSLSWSIDGIRMTRDTVTRILATAIAERAGYVPLSGRGPVVLQVGDVVCASPESAAERGVERTFYGFTVVSRVNVGVDRISYTLTDCPGDCDIAFSRHQLTLVESSSPESIDYLICHMLAYNAREDYEEARITDGDDEELQFRHTHDRVIYNWRDDLTTRPLVEDEESEFSI